MAQVYRIQYPDGTFSTGGSWPGSSKKGKLWVSKQALSAHLNLVIGTREGNKAYKGAKLITYELSEVVVDEETLESVIETRKENKAKREAALAARVEARRKEARRKEYEKLSKEFGQ